MKPGEMTPADFARDLFRHGVYVLPCGGGVISEPRRALAELERRYGREGLLRESRILLLEAPCEGPYPEGSEAVAMGIIYHLAEGELLRDLVETRRRWLESDVDLPGRMRTIETLISGIAPKLGLPCPEGVAPMDPQECDAFLMEG